MPTSDTLLKDNAFTAWQFKYLLNFPGTEP